MDSLLYECSSRGPASLPSNTCSIFGDIERSSLITQIPSTSLPAFHARYGALLKSSMAPQMRKRDKKKEKLKAEAVAKKRKELYVDVDLGNGVGDKGKRGAGRRQRVSTGVYC